MQIKKIKIGSVETPNNLFFAPLAGFSDSSMRKVCSLAGAGLCFTEMVSCKGLKYTPQASSELLETYDGEKIKAVQIFGADENIMGEIASSGHLEKFDIIDINMGCPVPKIYSNGEGSFLLSDIKQASKIISSVAKSGKPVTVKFRIGLTENNFVTRDFAKMCEDSGASLITIHGRVRTAYYSGEVNYLEIEKAKNAVSIPVIANGGIFTKLDADIMMDRTGADGVMIARGALENPLIFSQILGKTCDYSLKDLISIQIDLLKERYGTERGAIVFRKQASYYLKGVNGGKKLKEEIFASLDIDKVREILLSVNL
ncbi:MAG: tRNA-dihydrouridine synthase family protein [Clostridiales bacterium]|nr:tRNA-dihydrouridine synthase family protein [Clostridiales bacterium]